MWLTKKLQQGEKPPKLSKEEAKKLSLLEHYSPKDIQELLNYVAMNTKKEIDKTI
ncbi:MAG: hypothetical protein J6T10_19770 [Methanobrevibacter sp.]|nr:hypothetical protein [Methanobrevibacter sp.]MBO7694860.1 hypothetical protein [Methanobrevibacter sp.]